MDTLAELSITNPTEFERLMVRVNKESLEIETSLQYKNNMGRIIKEIASVYFFIRKQGLGYTPITIEEFEVIQKRLLDLAKQKTSQPVMGLFKFGWRYFLKNKFFSHDYNTVIGWRREVVGPRTFRTL